MLLDLALAVRWRSTVTQLPINNLEVKASRASVYTSEIRYDLTMVPLESRRVVPGGKRVSNASRVPLTATVLLTGCLETATVLLTGCLEGLRDAAVGT